MTESIRNVHSILEMNKRLFLNALEGISEEQAKERISEHNNPVNWIATHTIWARYNISLFLGMPAKNPYNHLFENFKAYESTMAYYSMGKSIFQIRENN